LNTNILLPQGKYKSFHLEPLIANLQIRFQPNKNRQKVQKKSILINDQLALFPSEIANSEKRSAQTQIPGQTMRSY
jgi:hypothetical protein